MSESLAKFLLKKREENKDQMETGLKTTYIGDVGELFALKYLKKLLERNNIKNDIAPHNSYLDDYDLDIYINGRRYKVEIKTSTLENYPVFHAIHFNNNFKYLLLIWHPSNDKIYFAILAKEEAKGIATPENTNREEEDNWKIHRITIFDDDDNQNFLNRLSRFLELNKDLEDLEDNEKIELLEDAKEEIMKIPNAVRKDFSGETYQEWIYEYLSDYTDEVKLMPNDDDYDIEYKGRRLEVKYSVFHRGGFQFKHIKPKLFHFIFLIGFEKKENKFYFSILTSDEILEIKRELAGDEFYSENGFVLHVGKHSIVNFVNDFTFEDFDNYIKTH